MKIALTTNGPTLDGEIAVRFGRGTYLLIVDHETLSYRAAPNLYMTLRGEVQPALAQSLARQNVTLALAGYWAPLDIKTMQSLGISVRHTPRYSARQVLADLQAHAVRTPDLGTVVKAS